jgi:ABC-type sugar transport system ATPase subunit
LAESAVTVPEIIRLDRVSKRFGGIVAVNEVSFAIGRGEIHAVVGENGAGKSTIMKMLAGVHQPDSGTLVLRGEPTTIADPLDARRLGLSIVFQELNLFPHLSVAANIFANRELAGVGGLLDERRMVVATRRILDEMGVDLDPAPRSASSRSARSSRSRSPGRSSRSRTSSSWTNRTRR